MSSASVEVRADSASQLVVIGLVELRRLDFALGLAGLVAQVVDGGADFLDFGMAELDRVDDRLFLHFFRARLDHHDAIGGSDDHDVQQALAHLVVRRIHDELAIDQADAHGADRPEEWNVRNGERRRMRR